MNASTSSGQFAEHDDLLRYLASLSGQHVHFFPKPGNAGDGFIDHATYEIFRKFDIRWTSHAMDDKVDSGLVLIGGGGNLIEGRYADVAHIIRRHADCCKVVLLPHTIVGYSDILAETHRNLTVFCRDPISYKLAALSGANSNRIHLVHDMVFYLSVDHFEKLKQQGSGILNALRVDGETASTIPIPQGNVDLSLSWNGDIWHDPAFCELSTKTLAAFIAPHQVVQTDRLHISILAAFLGKDVFLLPNAYFKNRAIFEHSIQSRFKNVSFVDTLPMLHSDPLSEAFAASSLNDDSRAKDASNLDLDVSSAAGEGPSQEVSLSDIQGASVTTVDYSIHAELMHKKEQEISERERLNAELLEKMESEVSRREVAERRLELIKDEWKERLRESVKKNRMYEFELQSCEAGARQELAAARKDFQTLENELNLIRAYLDATHHSTSWRVTRPLRAIKRRLSR